MKNIPELLNNTSLSKNEKTTALFNTVVRKAFLKASNRVEAETAMVLAYKYELPCLEYLLSIWNDLPVLHITSIINKSRNNEF